MMDLRHVRAGCCLVQNGIKHAPRHDAAILATGYVAPRASTNNGRKFPLQIEKNENRAVQSTAFLYAFCSGEMRPTYKG